MEYDLLTEKSPLGPYLYIFQKNQHKYINDRLVDYDLNIIQGLFLIRIYHKEGSCQKDLAELFFLSKSSVAKSLRILEDNNFIIRERLPNNRRQYILKLSSKGEEMIPIIKGINKEWEDKMGLDKLKPEFMDIFRDLTFKSIYLNGGK